MGKGGEERGGEGKGQSPLSSHLSLDFPWGTFPLISYFLFPMVL